MTGKIGIDKYRIGKIKIYRENSGLDEELIDDLENFSKEDIKNIVEQNREAVSNTISLCARGENETNEIKGQNKKIKLKKYITMYLSNLTIDEESVFEAKLYYYIEKFKDDFGEYIEDNKVLESFDNIEFSKKKDLLFNLLFNTVLLPETENQTEFNIQMDRIKSKFIERLDLILKKTPITIKPINAKEVLVYLDAVEDKIIRSSMVTQGLIDKVSCLIDMQNLDPELDEPIDEFSFSLNFVNTLDSYISQDLLKNLLSNLGNEVRKVGEQSYIIGGSAQLNYQLHIFDPIIDMGIIEYGEKMTYEVKISAIPHNNIKTLDFLAISARELPGVVEDFTSMLYKVFGKNVNGEEVEGSYPTSPQIFDIMDHFNDEEGEKGEQNVLNGKKIKSESDKYEFYENPLSDISFDEVILEESEKETIVEIIDIFQDYAYYNNNGGDMPTGIIFEGQPGGGKTTSAKIIAKESGSAIIVAKGNMQDAEVGQSEKNIQSMFDRAKKYVDETEKNIMIFFDEADTLFSKRGGSTKDFKEGMFSVLSQEMDGFDEAYKGKIFVVFATNRTDMLDSAVKSRCNKIVEFKMPNFENRIKHLQLNIDKKAEKSSLEIYDYGKIDFDKISNKLDKKSGRFIKNLISNVHNKFLRLRKNNENIDLVSTKFILDLINVTEEKEKNEEKIMGFDFKEAK